MRIAKQRIDLTAIAVGTLCHPSAARRQVRRARCGSGPRHGVVRITSIYRGHQNSGCRRDNSRHATIHSRIRSIHVRIDAIADRGGVGFRVGAPVERRLESLSSRNIFWIKRRRCGCARPHCSRRKAAIIVIEVEEHRDAKLPEVICILCRKSASLDTIESRNGNAGQHRDDRDDDEQLDESETVAETSDQGDSHEARKGRLFRFYAKEKTAALEVDLTTTGESLSK